MVGQEVLELEHPRGRESASHGGDFRGWLARVSRGQGRDVTPVVGRGHVGLGSRGVVAHTLLDGVHRQPLGHDALGQVLLEAPVRRPQQRPGVAGGDGAIGQGPLDAGGELEEPECVGHGRAALATRDATCSWV